MGVFKVAWSPISIHAFQTECDSIQQISADATCDFYPRTPNGVRHALNRGRFRRLHFYPRTPNGVRPPHRRRDRENQNFYPRTPNGVRRVDAWTVSRINNFYPRTPNGVRRNCRTQRRTRCNFYPRTPNGVRLAWSMQYPADFPFLSTHSKRSATVLGRVVAGIPIISIHALQTECDCQYHASFFLAQYFYPRTPNGVRHY